MGVLKWFHKIFYHAKVYTTFLPGNVAVQKDYFFMFQKLKVLLNNGLHFEVGHAINLKDHIFNFHCVRLVHISSVVYFFKNLNHSFFQKHRKFWVFENLVKFCNCLCAWITLDLWKIIFLQIKSRGYKDLCTELQTYFQLSADTNRNSGVHVVGTCSTTHIWSKIYFSFW